MTLIESVIEEIHKREFQFVSGLVGAIDEDTKPYAEQMNRMRTTGFMRTIAMWYANGLRQRFPDGVFPVDTNEDEIFEEDLTDDLGYVHVTEANIDFFSPYLIDYIVEDILARPDFICIGGVREDGYTWGVMVLRIDEQTHMAENVWLYTSPSLRGFGKGRDVLQFANLILKKAGVKSIYNFITDQKNTTTASEIREKYAGQDVFFDTITEHFVSIPYTTMYEKLGDNIPNKESCLLLDEVPDYYITNHLDTCEPSVQKRLNHYIEEAGDIISAFDESSCVIYKDGQIKGVLLAVPREDEKGTVLLLLHATDAAIMAAAMSFSIERARRKYGDDGYLSLALLNGMGKRLGEFYKIEDSWIKIYAIGRNL